MKNVDKIVLPSNGLLEGTPREVEIRGMMGREISTLFSSFTDTAINEIVGSVTKPALDPMELCDEDKLFILHQTRILTFGMEVEQTMRCPSCRAVYDYVFNYEDFDVKLLEEDVLEEKLKLSNEDTISRRVATPEIQSEILRYKEKANLPDSYAYILLQATRIGKVNGKRKSIVELIEYLENLRGGDLIKIAKFLDFRFGINTNLKIKCSKCNHKYEGGIGINADLFREPSISL